MASTGPMKLPKRVLFASVDEFDVCSRVDLQPLQDRRQVFRDTAALAFDDGTAGPIHQFQVIPDFVRNRTFRIVRFLIGYRADPESPGK